VLLDVVVKDKKGTVVNNLDANDFTVYEDGVFVKVTSFESPEEHTFHHNSGLLDNAGDLAKIDSAPVTILVLDELNTSFEDMAFARQKVEKYLDSQPSVLPQPTTLLVASNTALQTLHNYTQSREELRATLKKHLPELPYKMMHGGTNSASAYLRMAESLQSLHQISVASRGVAGRKSVIWVGKGFPTVNLLLLDSRSSALMQEAVQHLTGELLEARVAIYTIDPASNVVGSGLVASPEELNDFEGQSDGQPFADGIKFSTLAPATGGQAFFARNDLDNELRNAAEQGGNYYTLSYIPNDTTRPSGSYHHIRVTVKNPDLVAVTRDGYYTMDKGVGSTFDGLVKNIKDIRGELEAELGSAALSSLAYNGVDASIEKGGDNALTLFVRSGSLNWTHSDDERYRAEITVLAVAFSSKGKILSHTSKEMQTQTKGHIGNPDQKAQFAIHLPLPMGTARVRIIVRDALSGKIGSAEINL